MYIHRKRNTCPRYSRGGAVAQEIDLASGLGVLWCGKTLVQRGCRVGGVNPGSEAWRTLAKGAMVWHSANKYQAPAHEVLLLRQTVLNPLTEA